jgi:hypothetical protein
MKKRDIKTGDYYIAKVSGKLTTVRILGPLPYTGGWDAINIETRRPIVIKSAARLRRKVYDHA